MVGATPIFCDIYDQTFNIDAEKLSESLKEAYEKKLNPKAIMPVDLFGLPARYRLIEKFDRENKLLIIEDAAQGLVVILERKKQELLEMWLEHRFFQQNL